MKLFSLKVFLFLLPIFIMMFSEEYMLRRIPNDYTKKREVMLDKEQEFQVLSLGSSHTYYGVDPQYFDLATFNASHISQSVDVDYLLVHEYLKNKKSIKYVTLPIDYQSLFRRLSKGSTNWRMKNYVLYYDLAEVDNFKNNFEIMNFNYKVSLSRLFNYYVRGKDEVTSDQKGFAHIHVSNKSDLQLEEELRTSAIKTAKRHTAASDEHFEYNTQVLRDLAKELKKQDITLVLYTSPCHSSYVELLDENQLSKTIDFANSFAGEYDNIHYVNYLQNPIFKTRDFSDSDHLNEEGAHKLSVLLNQEINKLEKAI
ncbi:hypothetical protein [Flammeovirga sp. SubArs3]|uniref:hypothetical protein n=1 Tax=Flammeovirga sp. SubArs3 TaxID=2995316 RepID=UPI00248CC937|nr:hypothetical protein [Flammeovirga sp. SubArs3]